MSKVGWIVLVFGVILGVFAFSMDTTVTTDSQSIAGVSIPSQRVNNIGLMDERRNYLMVAGLMVVVGVGLIVAGELQKSATATSTSQAGSTTKCPYCAEVIKSEAVVCRFCGRDLPAPADEQPDIQDSSSGRPLPCAEVIGGQMVCPSCGRTNPAGTTSCSWCHQRYRVP